MAEAMLIGAGIGAGTSMLSGQDPIKGAALGGAMGGATAGFGGAGVASGAGAGAGAAGSTSMMQTLATPAMTSGATAAAGSQAMNTMNPALTNGLGQSSNALTQFGRDAGSYMSDMGSNISDTVGQGFDYMNDKTGMENKDWTKMAMGQAQNSMQPDPQQQLQAAPMGQGISRPQVDLSQSAGSLLSSNPLTSGPGGRQMTQKDYELLKQGLL